MESPTRWMLAPMTNVTMQRYTAARGRVFGLRSISLSSSKGVMTL
uniref:Uncharacterized protein n=1 Tax=Anguilla anguilla TaxID=7936 RepID=A0A0E9VQG5_ANGAN